jgi:transposase
MNTKELLEENKQLKLKISEQAGEISLLKERVSVLEILHFGPKSERRTAEDDRQGRLFNEAEDAAFSQDNEEEKQKAKETTEVGPYTRRRHRNQGRTAISRDLPRIIAEYDIPEEDKRCACGEMKVLIGEDVSERVKLIPARVEVIEERRKKYACRNCEGTEADEVGVKTACGVKHLIPRSIADESFLAWTISEKFEYALPFYRQSKRLASIGLTIPRSTLGNQAVKAALACKPLYELLRKHTCSGLLINADETRLKVLSEPDRKGGSLSWMWVFAGGPPGKKAVIFHYDRSRSSEVPKKILRGFRGYLQTDDYESYHTALKYLNTLDDTKVIHILCWQHARSNFHKAWKASGSKHAETALDYIQDLFKLEKLREKYSLRGFNKQRKWRAQLIFEEFKKWLVNLSGQVPPKNLLGKAVSYTLDNWEQLIRYIESPYLTPSNNLAENAIRPFVIGRKNWLFAGTPAGAESSAILYSLIESAKLNDLNPYDYLFYIFRKIPYAETEQDWLNLMPHNLTQKTIRQYTEGAI